MFQHVLRASCALLLLLGIGAAGTAQSFTVRMNLRPMEVVHQIWAEEAYYDYYYNYYLPFIALREGFVVEPGNWWIGDQPFLPYYGYNPSTTTGYYPPYGYPPSGYFPGGYGVPRAIQPAPPLVTPPVQVPTLRARPIPPPPLVYRMLPGGGFIVERAENFQFFIVPPYPTYQTGGSVIYQTPPYRDYSPFPHYYPYPFPSPYAYSYPW